jgi:hypothetical protein
MNNYVPFGDEWKKNVMKLPKFAIVVSMAEIGTKAAALEAENRALREALETYAARENWWITKDSDSGVTDAIWQEGKTDAEPWKIADEALAKKEDES